MYKTFPIRLSGTFPLAIFAANPSATDVFPTPGSPINTGLFFVLLLNICIALSISFSLPITGSILFLAFATRVKFFPYLSNIFKDVCVLVG